MDAPYCNKLYMPPIEYVLCVGRRHPLFNEPVLSLEDVRNETFVTGHRAAPMYEWIKSAGVPDEKIYFDRFNADIKKALIDSGRVIGMISNVHSDRFVDLFGNDIRMIPMYPPLIISEVLMIHKKKIEAKDIVRSFHEFCLAYLDSEKYKSIRPL
mgnify:CR=1 FL=1